MRREWPRNEWTYIAFDIGANPPETFFKGAKVHRDGTVSRYVSDPDGNAVEWIHYPEGTEMG